MNAFKSGDLVVIVASPDGSAAENVGMVSSIRSRCSACECGILSALLNDRSYYQLNAFPGVCYREDVLKKIEGDRRRDATNTEETRDAPVEA